MATCQNLLQATLFLLPEGNLKQGSCPDPLSPRPVTGWTVTKLIFVLLFSYNIFNYIFETWLMHRRLASNSLHVVKDDLLPPALSAEMTGFMWCGDWAITLPTAGLY